MTQSASAYLMLDPIPSSPGNPILPDHGGGIMMITCEECGHRYEDKNVVRPYSDDEEPHFASSSCPNCDMPLVVEC